MNAADILLDPWRAPGHAARPAVLWRDEAVSYGKLAVAVARAAEALLSHGLCADQRVLFLSEDTPSLVAGYLGAIKAGGVAVALNPRLMPDDLRAILADSEPAIVIGDEDGMALYERVRPRLGILPKAVFRSIDFDHIAASHPGTAATAERKYHDMAFWIYTSGTTGRLKAAIHRHQDVLPSDLYLRDVLGAGPDDRLFASSKLFFAYALGTILLGTLRLGATAVLHDGQSDPEAIAMILARHRPSIVFSVPTLYRAMLDSGVAAAEPFGAVRHYVSAGERLPASLFARWRAKTGVAILDGMGTSETIYMLLSNRPDRVRPGSSGIPAPGVEARLRVGGGHATAAGMTGGLEVSIPSVSAGYWGQAAESARAFQDGWFSTGDIYRIDEDGYWHHEGRADDLFKVAGQWVSPGEIEELVTSEDGVRDAAFVGVPDADGLTEGVLFVVPREAGGTSPGLERALADRLPPHKRPRRIVTVAEIPRTATGKIQRFKLRRGASVG